MSAIEDFNRIEDCDKIDALCVNAYVEASLDEDKPTDLLLKTSWGDSTVDLIPAIKAGETLTTLYLSPANNPNCLVYEPERGDNICITGDALSRIISMKYLKDVKQGETPSTGDVYMYGSDNLFHVYNLQTFIDITNSAITTLQGRMAVAEADIANLKTRMAAAENAISALQATVANHESRLAAIEAKLTPPADAPSNVKVVFGNINEYSDPNAVVDSSGAATTLDKTHGLYTHTLSTTAYGDEIFG